MSQAVGIDLGTTYSLVAVVGAEGPRVVPLPNGGSLLPSVVSFLDPNHFFVGDRARDLKVLEVEKTVYSVKRFMGRGAGDLADPAHLPPFDYSHSSPDMVRLTVCGKDTNPIEISGLILRELKSAAEGYLKDSVDQAVITVPAYFNDSQRQATKLAARLAGLGVMRILNEPTAAALAYGWGQKKSGLVAVYDLGGGTFDISILKVRGGVFEVKATRGDTFLGGDDIDGRLAEKVARGIFEGGGPDLLRHRKAKAMLLKEAERVKRALSQSDREEFLLTLDDPPVAHREVWSRTAFESAVSDILERTRRPCEEALADAGVKARDLSDVVLVGGSTRIPKVRALVQEIFGRVPNTSVNPEEAVALGAAIQAEILSGRVQDTLLLDVVPLSLGIETMGGIANRLIFRNQTIPAQATEHFTTFVDGQTSVDIHVVQGEREMAQDNRSLARFQLTGIPPMAAGLPRIQVDFVVDANGILNVRAKELRTGLEQRIEVKPAYGLTDQEVERMLAEAYAHAEDDVQMAQLVSARQEALSILKATEKSLREAADLMTSEERQRIDEEVVRLEEVVKEGDPLQIRERIKGLDRATAPLAQRIIDGTIQKALKGQSVQTFRKGV